MRQVTVRFKLVTPAYIGGADPEHDNAELRAPSFRGLLRYWLRAAAGASSPESADVRKIEDATFGSVQRGSPLSLWLSDKLPPRTQVWGPGNRPMAPKVRPRSWEQRYLYWSMESRESEEKALPAGTEFNLRLALRGGIDPTGETLGRALGALWLLAHLGGIGARSRRGAGSLAPLRIEGLPNELRDLPLASLPFKPATSADDLCRRLESGIPVVRDLFAAPAAAHPDPAIGLPKFDVLAPTYCRVWILRSPAGEGWRAADDVLDALGASLQRYRRTIPLNDRAIFGLPIIAPKGGTSLDGRRASPLLLRVAAVSSPTGATQYLAVAVLFKTEFFPGDVQHIQPPPRLTLIEQWRASQFPNALEVRL